MPTYDYKCKIHGVFEAHQSIKAAPLDECPKCVQAGLIEHHCKLCDASWVYPKSEAEALGVPDDAWGAPICINCNSKEVEQRSPKPTRLISLGTFILKGGGWGSEGYK